MNQKFIMDVRRQVSAAFLATQKQAMLAEFRYQEGIVAGPPMETRLFTEVLFHRAGWTGKLGLYIRTASMTSIYEAAVYPTTAECKYLLARIDQMMASPSDPAFPSDKSYSYSLPTKGQS